MRVGGHRTTILALGAITFAMHLSCSSTTTDCVDGACGSAAEADGGAPDAQLDASSSVCTDVENTCDVHASCTRREGVVQCQCLSGYTGDGTRCLRVGKCTKDNGGCFYKGFCTQKGAG